MELPGVSAEPGLEPAAHRAHRGEREQRREQKALNTHMDEQRGPELRQDSEASRAMKHRGKASVGATSRWDSRFSAASPMMIFPPLLLVFSTESAVLRPCSCFPRPWPSLKPYFCIILWATVPLCGGKKINLQSKVHSNENI